MNLDQFFLNANPQWRELPNAEDSEELRVVCECEYEYFVKFYPPQLDRVRASRARAILSCPGCGKEREAFAEWVPFDRSAGLTGKSGYAVGDPGSFGDWDYGLHGWRIRIRAVPRCPICSSDDIGVRRRFLRRPVNACRRCGSLFRVRQDKSRRFLTE